MHALEAQGSEQKRKACINFTQMNLFSKWYCNGNTFPHNWNLWTSYVIILVQCNFFMIFQSIVIPVLYYNKFLKFVCNVIDLCTTLGKIIKKIVWSFPLKQRTLLALLALKSAKGPYHGKMYSYGTCFRSRGPWLIHEN